MPVVPFENLPESARLWVFGAAAPVTGAACDALLAAVDTHLTGWAAHGAPLVSARAWRDDRFLAVAVDEAATGASGCSIDGFFRVLTSIEPHLGTAITDAGRVFWRDAQGAVQSATRQEFRALARDGAMTMDTPVFDTTVATVGAWRAHFERAAATSWHARLLGATV